MNLCIGTETESLESPKGMLASDTVAIVPGDNSKQGHCVTFWRRDERKLKLGIVKFQIIKFRFFVDAQGRILVFDKFFQAENCDKTAAAPKSPRNITSRNANKLFKLWQPLVKPVSLINRKNTLRKVKLSVWIEWKGPNLNRINENSHSQRKNNQAEVAQPGWQSEQILPPVFQ